MHPVWRSISTVIPVSCWRRLADVSLVLPYYHMVSDAEVPHVRHLYQFRSVSQFKADLEFVSRHMDALGLQDVIDVLDGTRALRRSSFHLTFDDGFREMHDVVAPLLHRRGIPATFFINTAFLDQAAMAHHNALSVIIDRLGQTPPASMVKKLDSLLPASHRAGQDLRERLLAIRYSERAIIPALGAVAGVDLDRYLAAERPYLSSDNVRDLIGRGFSIGAHSHDHPLYSDIPLESQISQTRTSMDLLKSRFNLDIRAFAFPHTDSGVTPAFFQSLFSADLLKVSFGTGGMVRHFYRRNLERVSMEKTAATAPAILARQYARAIYRQRLTARPH